MPGPVPAVCSPVPGPAGRGGAPSSACCALRPGMQVDVRSEAEREARAPRQQARREVERHAVEVVAQEPAEADVDARHERQRGQEVLAELAVGDPRPARLAALEGERVDEHRSAGLELHVVGGRVAQGHARLRGRRLDAQRQERGVLELAEGPLVGVGDELERLGPDDAVGRRCCRQRRVDLLVGDDEAVATQALVEARWPGRRPSRRRRRPGSAGRRRRRGGRRSRPGRGTNPGPAPPIRGRRPPLSSRCREAGRWGRGRSPVVGCLRRRA